MVLPKIRGYYIIRRKYKMLAGNQNYAILEQFWTKRPNIFTLYMHVFFSHWIKFVLHNLCQIIMHSTKQEKLIISSWQPAVLHYNRVRPNK